MKRKVLIVVTVAVLGMYMLSLSATKPTNLGVVNGQFLPLPDSPNAVSTQTEDLEKKFEPIPFAGTPAEMIRRIEELLESLPRTKIVSKSEDYIHVEFRSLIFRFVDDVEFYVDPSEKVIHFRSASRVGHSDLGANRNRMENIIAALE